MSRLLQHAEALPQPYVCETIGLIIGSSQTNGPMEYLLRGWPVHVVSWHPHAKPANKHTLASEVERSESQRRMTRVCDL